MLYDKDFAPTSTYNRDELAWWEVTDGWRWSGVPDAENRDAKEYYAGFPGDTTWESSPFRVPWWLSEDAMKGIPYSCAEEHSSLGTYKDTVFSTKDWRKAGWYNDIGADDSRRRATMRWEEYWAART